MISGHGTIETAVAAIKIGAYDFIEKPFKTDRLLLFVERAIEAARLKRENEELRLRAGGDEELIGASSNDVAAAPADRPGRADRQPHLDLRAAGRRQGSRRAPDPQALAPRRRPVRGGELRDAAPGPLRDRIVRRRSRRRRPAAQHRPVRAGAWRHAVPRRSRRHAAGDAGQDRPRPAGTDVQPRRRHGKVEVDVRVIASTSRELPVEIAAGRFREDLYYRLAWCRSRCRRWWSGARIFPALADII